MIEHYKWLLNKIGIPIKSRTIPIPWFIFQNVSTPFDKQKFILWEKPSRSYVYFDWKEQSEPICLRQTDSMYSNVALIFSPCHLKLSFWQTFQTDTYDWKEMYVVIYQRDSDKTTYECNLQSSVKNLHQVWIIQH